MFSNSDTFAAPAFWHNGPAPGSAYNFPGKSTPENDYVQRSKAPITTATSIIAMVFDKGVIIAGDLLASYGSLARYRNCPRVMKVNKNIILGAGGDYGDFQYIENIIKQKIIDEQCLDDGFTIKPNSLFCWLSRILYNRRSKFDPFWNNFVVGGLQDGKPFLATVDKLGTAYADRAVCTGYGAYMVLPIMRAALERDPALGEREARDVVHKCMEVLFYRDARSYPKYQVAVINADDGAEVEGPIDVQQNWNLANMIH